ncbi:MAG: SCP2 sterol-binding domain-containing protein, partial [Conexibacter sp.]
PERAVAACRAAARAAGAAHDHEQAAGHLRSALALIPASDLVARAPLQLELGEQELLSADLTRARVAFRAAADAARATGDAATHACAALGFSGGDVGFGWETGADDAATVPLLREGLDALGDDEPRLALRMTFRLSWALAITDDDQVLADTARRAQALHARLGDPESELLARFTALVQLSCRGPDPPHVIDYAEEFLSLVEVAERCGRDDLLLRVLQNAAAVHYALGQIAACEAMVERTAEIAARLGSPRFAWEADAQRAYRLLERGERAAGEALLRRAGGTIRRLRPDLQAAAELGSLVALRWLYDGEVATFRDAWAAIEKELAVGMIAPTVTAARALAGDHEGARRELARLLTDDLRRLRRPDVQLPASLAFLALAATESGDRAAGERLHALLGPLRGYLVPSWPLLCLGHVVEWHLGRLQLLAGRHEQAVEELRTAVARADELGVVWMHGWALADLARALHRRGLAGDGEAALDALARAEAHAERYGLAWSAREAAAARAELEGRTPPADVRAPERMRPLRALTTRGTRRALAATVRGLDDAALERRFADPRRQRALLRAMARGFQPARAGGFRGVVAYEIEPFAIDPPPEAPWRWAIEVDAAAGRAHLREPAPLDAATTIHIGLADWVRAVAGERSALTAMAAGRCSVAGDVLLAARLEAMFGGAA